VTERGRPKPRKLEKNPELHEVVAAGLALEWSPRQVSERPSSRLP